MQSTSSDNSVDNDLAPENLQGFLRAENILILDILAFGDPVARWQGAGAPPDQHQHHVAPGVARWSNGNVPPYLLSSPPPITGGRLCNTSHS